MAVKAAALMFIITFSLSVPFTVSSCSFHTSFSSDQVQEANKGGIATNCKPKPNEAVQNIKFAAAHGGGGAVHGGGVAHGSSAGHGVGGSHGEGGGHGDGNGESSSTPGTAKVIPVYGAAAAGRREHQSHKGGVHSHTCNLTMLTAAIFLSTFL